MSASPLKLTRPLAIIDLETTSADVPTTRTVQFGLARLDIHGVIDLSEEFLINPGIPIPQEATAVHGITDAMVRDQPGFSEIAPRILHLLEGCDLAGFNLEKFDLPILIRQLNEAGYPSLGNGRRIIDAMTIFHRNERRDLTAAVRFYLKRDHNKAHSALADAQATAEVLMAQQKLYGLPTDTEGLDAYCHQRDPRHVDADGKFVWASGEVQFNFGKYKGVLVREVVVQDANYLQWMVDKGEFSDEVRDLIRVSLTGEFPQRK